jgi:uncharacterized FAD-dependent dehydrogenase
VNIEAELSFTPAQHAKLPAITDTDVREKDLRDAACRKTGTSLPRCTILKKSIDARKKQNVRIIYRVRLTDEKSIPAPPLKQLRSSPPPTRPVVVGFGPAGMFAALVLARRGFAPVVIERGRPVEERRRDVDAYFRGGSLLPYSNVQFGEGGAGTFSDGKLYSGVSDPRRTFVLDTFADAGAPPEIRYLSHPHIGTDRLQETVRTIRKEIISLGGTILFERTARKFVIDNGAIRGLHHVSSVTGNNEIFLAADSVILAIGHSSRDTYLDLHTAGISMTPKPFAVGVRIEHPQKLIDASQYGPFAGHPELPPAEYKLVSRTPGVRSLYTFCMCPGGYVVAGASESVQVVTNGMSNYLRNGPNANSAILVGVDAADFPGTDALAGLRFQESLEQAAFIAGGNSGMAPCQRFGDFLAKRPSTGCGAVRPTFRPGVTWTDLHTILPGYVAEAIRSGVSDMNRKIAGFAHPDSLLTGIETRSSAPVRIVRDESLQSPVTAGFYPCGEGAGHAGGIMSSAIDGIKCAERVIERLGC